MARMRVPPRLEAVPLNRRQLALEALGEVRPEPRMGLELEGVRRLVQRDPGPERCDRDAERVGGRADVLLDEEEPAVLGLRGQDREVVLAEDARCP